MINRNVTRTILNSTESTAETQSLTSNALSFVVTTSDFFYMGFNGKFTSRYFSFDTANTNSTNLTVEYWDGSAYQAVEDLIDQTEGFTQDGFLAWQNVNDWKATEQTPIDDRELFWIRVSVSADLSAGTSLQSCINLFSDDTTLRIYYPWLINDTRYLPTGRTDFLEQHKEAKEMVIKHLRDRRTISEESQVIDINYVYRAAVHACAYLILLPISTSDELRQLRDDAFQAFVDEVGQTKLGTDQNRDGIQQNAERRDVSSTFIKRR